MANKPANSGQLELISKLFNYDSSTGLFTWKERVNNKAFNNKLANKVAGTLHNKGYISLQSNLGSVLAHNLAWYMVNGVIPKGFKIDHIDRVRSNNPISNLRLATDSENMWNCGKQKNTKSKFKGAWWHKTNKKWVAEIKKHRKKIHIGCFENELDAAKAYDSKSIELHGEFSKTNKDLGLYE